jgi:hypothetical protein
MEVSLKAYCNDLETLVCGFKDNLKDFWPPFAGNPDFPCLGISGYTVEYIGIS